MMNINEQNQIYIPPVELTRQSICLGIGGKNGFIHWGDTLYKTLDIEHSDEFCIKADPLGGLLGILKDMNLLFYDAIFNPITDIEDEHITYINIPDEERWFYFKKSLVAGERLYCVVDISENLITCKRIIWEKEHDSLTQLFNRESFLVRCEGVLSSSNYGLMIFIDLDDLKQMNDNWGHKTGDNYIIALAKHIESVFSGSQSEHKVYGRLAGDEFAVCLGGFDSIEERDKSIEGLNVKLDFILPNGNITNLSFTTGASKYPEDSASIDDLLIFSDFAMSVLKKNNKGGVSFFSKQEHEVFLDISQRQDKLNELLNNKAISFIFIPYIDNESGNVAVFEMFPIGLIPGFSDIEQIKIVAKYAHKLVELDRIIYSALKEEFKKLAGLNFKQVVTLGYMPQDLFYQGELEKLLQHTGYPSRRICLCFNSEMRSNYDRMRSISQAKDLGIRFGFKDFGPKSSQAALDFYPNIVKLSKELSFACARDDEKKHIVKNLIELAKKFKFGTASGYIASEEDLIFLRGLGIDLLGGEAVLGQINSSQIETYADIKHS